MRRFVEDLKHAGAQNFEDAFKRWVAFRERRVALLKLIIDGCDGNARPEVLRQYRELERNQRA